MLMIVGGGLDPFSSVAEAKSKGMKALIISKTPKTLVSNIFRTRVESASIAGISYTMSN